jgi:hypothetical protein
MLPRWKRGHTTDATGGILRGTLPEDQARFPVACGRTRLPARRSSTSGVRQEEGKEVGDAIRRCTGRDEMVMIVISGFIRSTRHRGRCRAIT